MSDEKTNDHAMLPVPEFAVLYRDQSGDEVVPRIDAMFREEKAAERYLTMHRPLQEHEFLTLETVDHLEGVATVHTALTADTMAFVITEQGPRAVPKEMAAIFETNWKEKGHE